MKERKRAHSIERNGRYELKNIDGVQHFRVAGTRAWTRLDSMIEVVPRECPGCAAGHTLVDDVHLDADNLRLTRCTRAPASERTP